MRKYIFSAIAVAALTAALIVGNSHAQTAAQGLGAMTPRYGAQTLIGAYGGSGTSVTNLHSAATNVNVTADVRFQKTFALQVEVMASAAGATLTIPFKRSVDSTGSGQFQTTLDTIALAIGAGTNCIVTNIDTYGAAYVNIPYLTNNHASSDFTNVVLKYGVKVLSP